MKNYVRVHIQALGNPGLSLRAFEQLVPEHWASIPKVLGSIPTVVRHIFQSARCGIDLE